MAKHHKQIEYVEPNTLIVGIDIGKSVHFVKMMLEGRQIAAFKLYNEGMSFMSLLDKIRQVEKHHQCAATLIGMEPTGHYWLPLAYFLRAHKQPFVLIQPSHVRWSKEMGDNSPLKTDDKDAGVIAELVRQGKSHRAYLPEGVYADLRALTAMRYEKKDQITAAKNVLHRILDVLFPEFVSLFSDITGKTAQQILNVAPTPLQIQALGIDELTLLIQKASNRRLSKAKAQAVLEAASTSIGVNQAIDSICLELMQTLCLMDLLKTQLQEIETQMNEHLQHIPQAGYMCSIPGLGPISVASILGETGPFEAYQAPEQLIKLAGLNLFEISSGYKKGTRRIAKRGRARLRRILYTAVFPLIFHNPIFKEAYHRFKGAGKPTQKAIIALCSKLLRILFALVNKQETFNINCNTKKEKVVSQVKKAA